MADRDLTAQLQKMQREWDARARENARFYVNTERQDWTDADFFRSGEGTVAEEILTDMINICQGQDPKQMTVLEIGCGAGRVTRALARIFGQVYGVDIARTAAEQYDNCKRIKHSDDANEGDLVFFHAHGHHITHVGVYLTNDYFVHASTSQGVVISNLNEDYWHKHYSGMGRVEK